jgi:hypothetical protein
VRQRRLVGLTGNLIERPRGFEGRCCQLTGSG